MFIAFLTLALLPTSVEIRATPPDQARASVEAWLKSVGKADVQPALDAIWASDRALVDKVADSIALGDAQIARVLAAARDPQTPAPQSVPELFLDPKRPVFLRANVALAYGKALAQRRVYEEALEALSMLRPQDVVEPASCLFHRAVAEHGLLRHGEALDTIDKLLSETADVPERYQLVAQLMRADLRHWRDGDLANIARDMTNIERRLELARGGPRTQDLQRDVVAKLDELIRRLEQGRDPQANLPIPPEAPQPLPGPRQPSQPSQPMPESRPGDQRGPGDADLKRFKDLTEQWPKLNEIERAKVTTELIRDLPPGSRQMVEDYFRKLAQASNR